MALDELLDVEGEQEQEERAFIHCANLVKVYRVADLEVLALQGLDLQVQQGELMAIIGASGSGKSTLLNVLGGLDAPTAGRVHVGEWDLTKLTPVRRALYRRTTVGFVWQNPGRNLVPYLSALENVELPMILAGRPDRRWARELLEIVGLGDRMRHRPLSMSGGEMQRVAIAIALANRPQVLLADEPTGALDSVTGAQILKLFRDVRDRLGVTILVVTHDRGMARSVDRFVEIRDGKTSAEAVRRRAAEATESLQDEADHDEYALLDSAGRVQLPREFLDQHGIKDRVKLNVEDGRIVIYPPENPAS